MELEEEKKTESEKTKIELILNLSTYQSDLNSRKYENKVREIAHECNLKDINELSDELGKMILKLKSKDDNLKVEEIAHKCNLKDIDELSDELEKMILKLKSKDDNLKVEEIAHECNLEDINELSNELGKMILKLKSKDDNLKVEEMKNDNFYIFNLFYVVFTYYRINHLIEQMKNILNQYYHEFNKYGFYLIDFIKFMSDARTFNLDEYMMLIQAMDDKIEFYSKHIGFKNQYAEVIASYYENHLSEINSEFATSHIHNAIDMMKQIIRNESYSKFYVNLGRLYSLVGDFNKAEENIKLGISEAAKTNDNNKVQEFLMKYNRLPSIRMYFEMNQSVRKLTEDAEELKEGNLKYISIISGIITFIFGGIKAFENIDNKSNFYGFFLIFLGTILISESIILTGLLLSKKKLKENRCAFIIYMILLFVAIVLICLGFAI